MRRYSQRRDVASSSTGRSSEADGYDQCRARRRDPGFDVRSRAALGRATSMNVVLETKEDPSLIAGIVTQVGDVIYDGSIAAQLQALRQRWTH